MEKSHRVYDLDLFQLPSDKVDELSPQSSKSHSDCNDSIDWYRF